MEPKKISARLRKIQENLEFLREHGVEASEVGGMIHARAKYMTATWEQKYKIVILGQNRKKILEFLGY